MHELLAPIVFVLHCDHQAFQHASETASPRSVPHRPKSDLISSPIVLHVFKSEAEAYRHLFGEKLLLGIFFCPQWGNEVSVEPSVPRARCLVSTILIFDEWTKVIQNNSKSYYPPLSIVPCSRSWWRQQSRGSPALRGKWGRSVCTEDPLLTL